MSSQTHFKRRRSGRTSVHKAKGVLTPRVQTVGPEHFGIVCVDVGEAKSLWFLCDFDGKVLIEPTEVLHTRCGFDLAILQLRQALDKYPIRDQVVAVERTGNYHLPVRRAFAAAPLETRLVHPFATKQFRLPADPGNKTDENDLDAMFRATVTGFGLCEPEPDELSQQLQLLSHPGINVVTAGELAGEMGLITHYANSKAITGRAGLFPSRTVSDRRRSPSVSSSQPARARLHLG